MAYWIKADSRSRCEKLYCSNCKQPSYTRHCKDGILVYHYCPWCGEKITGGVKEMQIT